MSSNTLGKLIRVFVAVVGLIGLTLCLYIIPMWGCEIISFAPECAGWYWPWLIYAWLFALPCFGVLVCVWMVSGAVIHETVFTNRTAKRVKTGAVLLMTAALLLGGGGMVLAFLNMNTPIMLILSVIGTVFMFTLALLAAVLSRYLTKAAVLQDESEGTI